MSRVLFERDPDVTAGVGSPEMTEAERRICDVVKVGCKVTAVDYADTAAPRVRVGIGDPDDEDGYILSGWLPIAHGRSNEWNPLKVGEVVMVLSEAGEYQNGVVIPAAVHNTGNPAPGDRGDLYRKVFADGGMVEYDEAIGALTISGIHSVTINGEATVNGSLDVTGNVTVANGASGTFVSSEGLHVVVQDGIVTNIY